MLLETMQHLSFLNSCHDLDQPASIRNTFGGTLTISRDTKSVPTEAVTAAVPPKPIRRSVDTRSTSSLLAHVVVSAQSLPEGTRFLKKNLNAPRPSEHPPVWGKKCQNV